MAAAFFASTPAQYSGDSRVPNVITPGVEVAEIAYLGTCLALLTVLLAVLHVAALVTQRRRAGPTPQGSR